MDSEMKDIRLEDLVPFKGHTGQAYKGERLQQLMDSIEKTGLISPIIVRPADNGKYEILCGHNRVKAVRILGHNTIRADVRYKVSDDMALELFFDSNLNQQSFLDWSYSQRFEAVKYIETLIKETSRQGKLTDLEKDTSIGTDNGTCVQSRAVDKPPYISNHLKYNGTFLVKINRGHYNEKGHGLLCHGLYHSF